MLDPFPERRTTHRYTQQQMYRMNRMNEFMYGKRHHQPYGSYGFSGPPMRQTPLMSSLQQSFHPMNLLGNPQVSKGLYGISGFLENIQQLLRIVETTTPIIREYGPMIKNLPAMYRMMKAIKEIDEEENTQEERESEYKSDSSDAVNSSNQEETRGDRTGLSTPKLYI